MNKIQSLVTKLWSYYPDKTYFEFQAWLADEVRNGVIFENLPYIEKPMPIYELSNITVELLLEDLIKRKEERIRLGQSDYVEVE